jgi:hypothetical protein
LGFGSQAFYINADPDPESRINADPDAYPGFVTQIKEKILLFFYFRFKLHLIQNRTKNMKIGPGARRAKSMRNQMRQESEETHPPRVVKAYDKSVLRIRIRDPVIF